MSNLSFQLLLKNQVARKNNKPKIPLDKGYVLAEVIKI